MRFLLASAATAAIVMAAPAAKAADMPLLEPGFSWTGFYLGAQAGYGWGRSKGAGFTANPKGALVGGYAGYNVQLDSSLVLGVETDFNWSDMDKRINGVAFNVPFSAKNDVKWAGATRARVGVAYDRVLVYGAAGVAYAKRKLTVNTPFGSASDSKTAVGWTIGGGVEAAVTDNLVTRVEYRYSDYGKDRFSSAGFGGRASLKEHRVMAGVAYKFSW